MRQRIRMLALAAAFAAAPFAAAHAQDVIVYDRAPPPGANISSTDARAIAYQQGVGDVRRVRYDRDDHRWTVEGRDYNNEWVEMEIDANTGVIVDIDR